MPTAMSDVQQFDAKPDAVYALFTDRAFLQERLDDCGGIDPQVVSVEPTEDGCTVITRQSIPSSLLPSMVASMMSGDPVTERTETWRPDGDGHAADFAVVIKGAPASLRGTMTLAPSGTGSTFTVAGAAVVPIPMFGGKIESIIAEQIVQLLQSEADFTRRTLQS